MIWECPETLRRATEEHRYLARIRQNMGKEPRCLWALGHIPAEWEFDVTEQTQQQPLLIDREVYDENNPVEKIGTDGGRKNNEKVGYGIARQPRQRLRGSSLRTKADGTKSRGERGSRSRRQNRK